jgi:hypothetical protein
MRGIQTSCVLPIWHAGRSPLEGGFFILSFPPASKAGGNDKKLEWPEVKKDQPGS